uniref:sensor histidine kinase n=1 Tax=Oscillatoria sp. FACHB-1407 TaxID=2692847 RepID=UPI0016879F2C
LGDRTIGALIVFFPHNRHFTEQQIELTYALAQQVTLAIQLTRLAEEAKQAAIAREQEKAAQERADELEKASIALQQTIDAVGQLEQLDALLPEVLKIVVAAFGARSCSYFEHPTDERIYLRYWFHEGTVYKPEQLLALSDRFTLARLLAQGFTVPIEYLGTSHRHRERAIVLDHVTGTSVPEFDAFTQQMGWGGELNVPLVCNGIAIGALVIYRETPAFTQGEVTLAESLGKQIALAMQTSQIAEREREMAIAREQQKAAQERAAELAKTNQALQASLNKLVDEPELQKFLGHILAVCVDHFGAIGAGIWQYDEEFSYLLVSYKDGMIQLPPELAHPVTPRSLKQMREDPDIYRRLACGQIVTQTEEDLLTRTIYQPFQAELQASGIRSLLLVPICLGHILRGSIVLRFDHQPTLNPEAAELAHAFANQAALALELIRLAEEVQQATLLEERNRMAREIHDTLAQAFTGIVVHQQATKQLLAAPAAQLQLVQEHLDWTIALAREGLQEARRSVYALRSELVQQDNLQFAFQQLAEQMTRYSSVEMMVSVRGTPYALPESFLQNLFRIGQEALTNALKHANAQHIHLEIIYESTHVHVRVQDNGQGFMPHSAAQASQPGFGLIGMQERAYRLGGQLSVTSQPTKGTEVIVSVPVDRA